MAFHEAVWPRKGRKRMRRLTYLLGAALILLVLCATTVFAADPVVTPEVKDAFNKLGKDVKVAAAVKFLESDHSQRVQFVKDLTVIEAPSHKEETRSRAYAKLLQQEGLSDVTIDEKSWNCWGVLPGTVKGPVIFVDAHLDTVFDFGSVKGITEDPDGTLRAPGIGDNTSALGGMLSVIRAFVKNGIKPVYDIVFVGTVGEEGLGDLKGMKAFLNENHPIGKNVVAVIDFEGGGPERITYLCTGSHRYFIDFIGPGGHSFGAFGLPSAIHAAGRAIAKVADVQVPAGPKTTFTVGMANGGTSVNSIAADCRLQLDMRSNLMANLLDIEKRIMPLWQLGADEENIRWSAWTGKNMITVKITMVGDRPAGEQSENLKLIQAHWQSNLQFGYKPSLSSASSTNINWSVYKGYPSICVGAGGSSTGNHSPTETWNPKDAWKALQVSFMTICAMAGVDGVSAPLAGK